MGLRLTTAGESHGPGLTCIVEGLPAGLVLVFFSMGLGLPSAGRPFEKRLQPWVKKGRVLAPGFAGTASQGRISAPCVIRLQNGRLRMYFWTTGRFPGASRNQSYIYAAEASPAAPFAASLSVTRSRAFVGTNAAMSTNASSRQANGP